MTSELINPYIAGAPVTEVRMFFGREDVFNWIQNSLAGKYTDHILVIHGQRRVGKTSVLKQLSNRLPEKYIPVFFDLQGRTHTTLDRFLWWLARETVRVLKQERNIDVPIPQRDDFARDPEFFENIFLPSLRPVLGENILLFTFDEFDNLEETDVKEELARPLIDHLRRLMGRSDMSFIFSIGSSGRKLENMQATYTEFFKTALYKKISFLSEEQTRGLITQPVQGLLEYDRAVVTHIYELASGHPYFTQLTCHELFARCQRTDQRCLKDDDLNAVLDDVVERGTVNLKFTWDESSDIEKWSLAALAQLDKTDNHTLAEFLRKQRVRFSDTDLTSGVLHLREKDILTLQNRFVIYLLKLWLQKNRPLEQVREELTEVNPIANRYIEIGLEFKNSGRHEKALESFQEALLIAPENIQAQVNVALVCIAQKAFDKAVVEFEKVLKIDDEDVVARSGLCDAHLALGDVALSKGRSKEAILSYQRVLSFNEEHLEARQRMADIIFQRAEKALENGKDEEALNAFAEALKFTPEDPRLVKRLETVRAEKKAKVFAAQVARAEKEANARNWEKAILALNEALETSPQDRSILQKIALIKERQQKERLDAILAKVNQAEKTSRWDTAIAALNEYLSLKPNDGLIQKRLSDLIEAKHAAWLNAIVTRADQAVADQKWDEATSALNEVLALESNNIEIQKKVAKVCEARRIAEINAILRRVEEAVQAGRWDDAINDLNAGVAADPENESLLVKLTEVRKAKREARLRAALRLVDNATQSGKWDAAIEVLNEMLAIEPDNVEFQKKLVVVKKEQRENKLNSLRTQARGFAKAEKFDESIAVWSEYLALEPDDGEQAQAEIESVKKAQSLLRTYVEAYKAYLNKNYEKAIELFKSIVVEDTDYKAAAGLLAESIELRRTARKWWQSKWLWGWVGGIVVLAFAWFALRSDLLSRQTRPAPTAAPAVTTSALFVPATSAATSTTTSLPTLTPTPLPFAWVRLNSGQFLSRDQITEIVFDPKNPGIIYVGMKNAGVYKSIDGGSSWQPSQNGLEGKSIHSLVIDPSNPYVLFAGVIQGGVYKTEDGGANWRAMNSGLDINGYVVISHVLMDSSNSQHLWYTNSFTSSQNAVLYETLNGGESWQQIMTSNCPDRVVDIAAHSQNNQVLIAGLQIGTACEGGVYLSADGGRTWEKLGLQGKTIDWVAISKTKDNSELLYAYARDGQLFGSLDQGKTWISMCSSDCRQPLATDFDGNVVVYLNGKIARSKGIQPDWLGIGSPGKITASLLAISPLQPNTLFLGGNGISLSTDGGKTWSVKTNGLGANDFYLHLPTSSGGTFYLMQDLASYSSTDQGRTWKSFSDKLGYLAFDSTGSLIYRLWQNEAAYSPNQGRNWANISLPLSNPDFIGVYPLVSERVFVAYGGEKIRIYSSDDQGVTWSESSVACALTNCANSHLLLQPDTLQTEHLSIRGDQYPLISDDKGLTWRACSWKGTWIAHSHSAVAIDPKHKETLYLATNGEGVNITTDGCQSWQTRNTGLGNLFINSLAIDPQKPETVYAGTDGGAYISTDGGQTWGQINDGLLGATVVYSIVVDKDSNVYAATPYGIFKLENK